MNKQVSAHLWPFGSCNNSWTTGWSDYINCLGFSDRWCYYQFLATNTVRSPLPIWSYQFSSSFRLPVWFYQFSSYLRSDRQSDYHHKHFAVAYINIHDVYNEMGSDQSAMRSW